MGKEGKTSQLQIRVTARQKAAIRRAAKRARVGMSTWVLQKLMPDENEEFKDIVRQLANEGSPSIALAHLSDYLSELGSGDFPRAVVELPRCELSDLLENLVAAMVEYTALRVGRGAPSWTREIEPLAEPYFASALESLRFHLLTCSPPVYRRRNLFVDATVGDRV